MFTSEKITALLASMARRLRALREEGGYTREQALDYAPSVEELVSWLAEKVAAQQPTKPYTDLLRADGYDKLWDQVFLVFKELDSNAEIRADILFLLFLAKAKTLLEKDSDLRAEVVRRLGRRTEAEFAFLTEYHFSVVYGVWVNRRWGAYLDLLAVAVVEKKELVTQLLEENKELLAPVWQAET